MKKNYTAVFVIPPGAHLLDFSGPAHIFYEAQDYGAPVDSVFVSMVQKDNVITSAGINIGELKDFREVSLRSGDLIFIPGLERELLLSSEFIGSISLFLNWLIEQHQNGIIICSVCTGAFVPAYAGLLEGQKATTHWKYLDRFQDTFPSTEVIRNRLFVLGNGVYSSAGVASGIDLALYILEELFGPYFASKIAREVVIYLRRGEDDPQLSVFLQYRNHMEEKIHKVQDWLTQHINQKVTVDSLAELVYSSPRNLTRMFKRATGTTIGQYLDQLRVGHALHLLEKGTKVESVATQCGLNSPNQLREILKKYTGKLPSELNI